MNGLLHHGGRLSDAIARFGGAPADWIDLSTGINPHPWPGASRLAPEWRGLPDPAALARLEQAAAAHFGVDPALCCAVAGSEMGLRLLGCVMGEMKAEIAPLTYGTYARAFARAGPGAPGLRILTNPNNPDGVLRDRAWVLAELDAQERGGGWLLVDEAFVECHPDASVASAVAEGRRLIVTRSFGKFFGLAGVRLGFVLAPSDILAELRRVQGDWPVCAAAIAFGTEAYRDVKWISATRGGLRAEAEALDRLLAHYGLRGEGASPLFRLVRDPRAGDLFRRLGEAHILSRPFAGHDDLLRLGLPASAAQASRLADALARWSAPGV